MCDVQTANITFDSLTLHRALRAYKVMPALTLGNSELDRHELRSRKTCTGYRRIAKSTLMSCHRHKF